MAHRCFLHNRKMAVRWWSRLKGLRVVRVVRYSGLSGLEVRALAQNERHGFESHLVPFSQL